MPVRWAVAVVAALASRVAGFGAVENPPVYTVQFHPGEIPDTLRASALSMTRRSQRWLCLANPPPASLTSQAVPPPDRPAVAAAQLKRLLGGRCYHAVAGWWRYEWCAERWVRQYHEEGGIVQADFVLGLGPMALTNDVLGNRRIMFRDGMQTMLQRSHGIRPQATGDWEFVADEQGTSQDPYYRTSYTDGTKCDLTGTRRQLEVQVHCTGDPMLNSTFSVLERATCDYVLAFQSALVCQWPEFGSVLLRRQAAAVPRLAAIDCYSAAAAAEVEEPAVGEEVPGGVLVQSDVIREVFQGQCFLLAEDWWTYQFCWDRWLRQFRFEGNQVVTHFLLGVGPDGLVQDETAATSIRFVDGDRPLLQDLQARHPLQATGRWYLVGEAPGLPPHYATRLPQGDFCASAGVERHVILRLFCVADPTALRALEVREPEPCEYSLMFRSPVPCAWPELRDAYAKRFLTLPQPLGAVLPEEPPLPPCLAEDHEAPSPEQKEKAPPAEEASEPVRPPIHQLFDGHCFIKVQGYWTYEWCYDKWVKQFHREHGVVASEHFLGLGRHALVVDAVGKRKVHYADGLRSTLQQLEREPDPKADGKWRLQPEQSGQSAYYATRYYDGTPCAGLTERSVEIRIRCKVSNDPGVAMDILEPEPCHYVLIVDTPALCDWPPFRT